jgi:hypothetical protein
MPPDPAHAPVFVLGSGRSGTTLLRQMLNAHPRIHLTHEAGFYSAAQPFRKRLSARAWLERYYGSFPFAWLGLSVAEVESELPAPLGEHAYPAAFCAIMRAKAQQHGKPRFGDKTPYDSRHVGAILKDFPDARIVHIVRDPRATVASLARMPWAPSSLGMVNLFALAQVEALAPFRNRIHEVRLEDLLAEPEAELRKLLEFVGEDWDPRVLEHAKYAPEDAPPYPWLASAKEAARPTAEGYRKALSPAWIRLIEGTQRKIFARYGYLPATLPREPSFWEKLGAVAVDVPRSLVAIGRAIGTFLALVKTPPPTAAEVQRRVLRLNPKGMESFPGWTPPEVPDVRRS